MRGKGGEAAPGAERSNLRDIRLARHARTLGDVDVVRSTRVEGG